MLLGLSWALLGLLARPSPCCRHGCVSSPGQTPRLFTLGPFSLFSPDVPLNIANQFLERNIVRPFFPTRGHHFAGRHRCLSAGRWAPLCGGKRADEPGGKQRPKATLPPEVQRRNSLIALVVGLCFFFCWFCRAILGIFLINVVRRGRHLRPPGAGPQYRRRLGRPARPRLRRVLRRRRLHHGAADLAARPLGLGSGFLARLPVVAHRAAAFGVVLGAPIAAARRLPGDRHPRLRRDLPDAGALRTALKPCSAGPAASSRIPPPVAAAPASRFGTGTAQHLLPDPRARLPCSPSSSLAPDARGWAALDRDARGRDGGRAMGMITVAHQAAGLRHRGYVRPAWPGRSSPRARLRLPRQLRVHSCRSGPGDRDRSAASAPSPALSLGAFVLFGLPELLREFAEYRCSIFGAVLGAYDAVPAPGSRPRAAAGAASCHEDGTARRSG